MDVLYVGHACLWIECGGVKILTDPWITGLAGGRYLHEPPLVTPLDAISSPDVVVLSHAHPDHFNLESLSRLSRRAVFVVPKHFGEIRDDDRIDIGWRNPDLAAELRRLGFQHVAEVRPGQEVRLDGGVRVVSVASHHNQFPEMGMVIQGGGATLYNGVDTWPGESALQRLAAAHPPDIAFLPFRYYLESDQWIPPDAPEAERARRIEENRRRLRWIGPLRATHAAGVLGVRAVVPGSEGFRDTLPTAESYARGEGPNYHEIAVGDRMDFIDLVQRYLPGVDIYPMGPGDVWSSVSGFAAHHPARKGAAA
jgi:L-ascorbate metabolism protein UlaG (beta-lactamase superfamily)